MIMRSMVLAAAILAGLQEKERKPLTPDEREKQLNERVSIGLLDKGSLDAFISMAYAMSNVQISYVDPAFGRGRVDNPFPEFYTPTWREVFETIARQTRTSWTYSEKKGEWLFDKPAVAPTFQVTLAKGWAQEDRGYYVFFKPPKGPVGMDIYMLGTYSFDKDADKEMARVRDAWALNFLKPIRSEAKIEDMKKVEIDGSEALHLEAKAPKPGVVWRQWVFAKNGALFAIVSALDEDQAALVKDVQAMAASFKFVAPKKDEKKGK